MILANSTVSDTLTVRTWGNMKQESKCVVLIALWFTWASASSDYQSEYGCKVFNNSCKTHNLSYELGSTVLLPCNFSKNRSVIVSWVQSPDTTVVTLTSDGRVNFSDPRFGRVSVFPNEGSRGNYSISIKNVNSSDLGCYRCEMGQTCVQVELSLKTEVEGDGKPLPWFYIYLFSGLACLIVLSIGCFFCVKYLMKKNRETEEQICSVRFNELNDDVGFPVEESQPVPEDGQQEGACLPRPGTYQNQIIYENDADNEPDYLNERPGPTGLNRNEFNPRAQMNFVREGTQRTRQRFHTELINRLRQASVRKHFYVNQDELHNKQDTRPTKGAIKKSANCQFQNPIYNRSTDNLNQM